jgi:orotidine-5'-phosphate decarboxylase
LSFQSKLKQATQQNNSLLCVGLDTDLAKLPDAVRSKTDPVLYFNQQIIDATADLVCCYKPNFAFYGALGESGWKTLKATIEHVPDHIPVLVDAKVGDIGNTAAHYAEMFFEGLGADGLTVTPYMGEDCVKPFLAYAEHTTFLVCLTSNKGADDFEKKKTDGIPLYEHVITKAKEWTTAGNCGLVIGATQPESFAQVRSLAPDMPLLIPGVGTQGGSAEVPVRNGCDSNGAGILVNSSRGIIFASSGEDYAQAARAAARELRDEMNSYRS